MRAAAFAMSPQPAGRASGPLQNFRPHAAPKFSLAFATRASRLPSPAPQPSRRRPASHPAVKRQKSAAPRPDRGSPQNGKAPRRRGTGRANPSCRTTLVCCICRPTAREPGRATLSAGPRRQAHRPRRGFVTQPEASRGVRAARQLKQTRSCAKDGASESFRAPDPRPKNPRSPGTSRCTHNATPDALRLIILVAGGGGSLRYASLWASCPSCARISPLPAPDANSPRE
jgi:hypothetical protein